MKLIQKKQYMHGGHVYLTEYKLAGLLGVSTSRSVCNPHNKWNLSFDEHAVEISIPTGIGKTLHLDFWGVRYWNNVDAFPLGEQA